MAKINMGNEIQCIQDIERLVMFYCKIKDYYTVNDIYNLVQENLEKTNIVIYKKLYKIIYAAVNKLIDAGFLLEQNGIYYHEKIVFVKHENTTNLNL